MTQNTEGTTIKEYAEEPCSKTVIKKVMTVLEMELQGGQCSFMGPGTHPRLMAPALINRAEDFGEHATWNVHSCCPYTHTPQNSSSLTKQEMDEHAKRKRKKSDGQETPLLVIRKGIHRIVSSLTQHQLLVQERAGICWGNLLSPEQPFP